ncbi:hypothetical protein MKX01_001672 [Papaver californicum]|nr:hypothetical protein MKX01_001672 [Papaver californicum]
MCRVLFLLDIKSMIQSCLLLSKNWDKNTWKTARNLVFDEKGRGREVFMNTVLENVPSFEKLELHMDDYILAAESIHNLYQWIDSSLLHNPKEVSIYIEEAVCPYINVTFPDLLFRSQSLEKLVIKLNRRFCTTVNPPNAPKLDKLRYLRLGSFIIQDLNGLISNCPVLETFILEDINMYSADELRVQSRNLRQFEILNDLPNFTLATRIRIQTPNLISLVCKDFMLQEYSLDALSSLQYADVGMIRDGEQQVVVSEAIEIIEEHWKENSYPLQMMAFVTALRNVRSLTISSLTFFEVLSKVSDLDDQLIDFPNLQHLKLTTWSTSRCWPAITLFLRTSPHLEVFSLTLQEPEYLVEDDAEMGLIEPQLSHLKRITVREAKGSEREYKFLKFLIQNCLILAQIEVYYATTGRPVRMRQLMSEFAEKIISVPRASKETLSVMFFEAN